MKAAYQKVDAGIFIFSSPLLLNIHELDPRRYCTDSIRKITRFFSHHFYQPCTRFWIGHCRMSIVLTHAGVAQGCHQSEAHRRSELQPTGYHIKIIIVLAC